MNFATMTAQELMTFIASVEFDSTEATEATAAFLTLQRAAQETRKATETAKASKDWCEGVNTLVNAVNTFVALPKPSQSQPSVFAEGESALDLALEKLRMYVVSQRPNQSSGKQGNLRSVGTSKGETANTAKRTLAGDKLHKFAVGEYTYRRGTDAHGTKEIPLEFPIRHTAQNDGTLLISFSINTGIFEKQSNKDALIVAFRHAAQLSELSIDNANCSTIVVSKETAINYLNLISGATVSPEYATKAQAFKDWRTNVSKTVVRTIKSYYDVKTLTDISSNVVFNSYSANESLQAYELINTTYSAIAPVAETVAENVPEIPKLPAKAKGKKQTV